MNIKKYMALSLPLFLLTINTEAAPFPQPQVCPDVASIQNVGVSHRMVQETSFNWFTGRRDQKYNTDYNWTFLIGKIPAATVDQAYNLAVLGLSSLSFTLGPVIGPLEKWVCYYSNAEGFPAVAVSPPIGFNNPSIFFNQ